MLQLDLYPGEALGPFKLGASLWSILAFVRQPQSKTLFPSVKISYDTNSSSTSIILVHLHPHIDLLFSGKGQRLHTIAIRRLRHGLPSSPRPAQQPLSLPSTSSGSRGSTSQNRSVAGTISTLVIRYKRVIISSADETLRRGGVMRHFGPTYEGETMRYPGVTFMFDDETPASSSLGSGGGSMRRAIDVADENKRAEVRKIVIMQRGDGREQVDAFEEVLEHPIMNGDLKRVVIKVNQGIDMYFYPSSLSPSPRKLLLGQSSAEDIRYELGEPMSVHYKDDDRITIHGASDHESDPSLNSYFMNYFNHGIDFLIDGQSHLLKKIVLHSNTVGSPLFQRYKRCLWEIADPSGDSSGKAVTYADTLEDHKSFLGQISEASQPMELDRSEEYEALSIPAYFTRLLGFEGIILESTTAGHVVAVTIY
ncbi:hypothetical protein FRC18_000494 [Serendipita sp. 400]|nr:hypothetical protein FRC18_000494 [Serendipita sp. 400]